MPIEANNYFHPEYVT